MTHASIDRSACVYRVHLVSYSNNSVDSWEFKTLTDFVDRCLALGISPSEYVTLNRISIDPYISVGAMEFDDLVGWVQSTQDDRKASVLFKSNNDGTQEVVLRIFVEECVLNNFLILDCNTLKIDCVSIRQLLCDREKFNQLITG